MLQVSYVVACIYLDSGEELISSYVYAGIVAVSILCSYARVVKYVNLVVFCYETERIDLSLLFVTLFVCVGCTVIIVETLAGCSVVETTG